jgi:hypothetical protein
MTDVTACAHQGTDWLVALYSQWNETRWYAGSVMLAGMQRRRESVCH